MNLLGGDQDLRTSTLIRQRPIRGENHLDILGESEGSLPPPHDSFLDAGEAIIDFWSTSGNFIYRHHVEPRVKLYSPREESFLIPLKYIDVSRTTHTNLDGQGDGVTMACPKHAAADSRGSRTCVCAITFVCGLAHAGRKGRINVLPWYRLVGVAIPRCARETRSGMMDPPCQDNPHRVQSPHATQSR